VEICEKNKCTGCLLCESVCPKGAVKIREDSAGFLYPFVETEKCISCGLCQKKCPENETLSIPPQKAYAAYTKNKDIRKASSSGGIFATLAAVVLKEGGVVFGAGYDGELNVLHKAAENPEELSELMGSKYVQSNTLGIYKKVAEKLDEGRKVLFCGTPCQCAALRNYAGEKENLLIVDLLCHGVPTPALWKKYLNDNFKAPESASFRSKKRGWEEFSMEVKHSQGVYNASLYKDAYLRMFLRNICLRESCHECSHKGMNYSSDITVADFWGISKVFPAMNDDKGCSAVILRSDKGIRAFEEVKDQLIAVECSVESISKINTAYGRSAEKPASREAFIFDMGRDVPFDELKRKYCKKVGNKEIYVIRAKRFAKKIIGKFSRLKRN